MKTKIFFVALLVGLFISCCKNDIEPMPAPPIEPEQPEKPIVPPLTEDLITIKINDEIMAIIGSNNWKTIAYGNGKYVAVSRSLHAWDDVYVTTSADGITWTAPKRIATYIPIQRVIYANGKFVAVGYDFSGQGNYEPTYDCVFTSIDGINWTIRNLTSSISLQDIAYGNGTFVACGNWHTITSIDGTKWNEPVAIGQQTLHGIAYGNDKFIAVGNSGYTTTSVNGKTWTTPISTGSRQLDAVAYGNGKFVAVSYSGYTITSVDGKTWTDLNLVKQGCYWNDITFGNGMFIIIGNNGYVAASADGETWSEPIQIKDESGNVITNGLHGVFAMSAK